MAQVVYVPTPLRKLTGGQAKVVVSGKDIAQLVEDLEAHFPGFKERICDERDEIKRFINIFINGKEIRSLRGRRTPLQDGDEVYIIPAMAGGVQAVRQRLGVTRQTVMGGVALAVAIAIVTLYVNVDPSLAVFWLFGLGFGFVLQRSRFCFASAFRDLFLLRDGRIMKGVIIGLAVATLGFSLIMYKAAPDLSKIPVGNITPLGLHTLLGGTLFGLGMVLAGGCASGTLYRMGEGYVALWVALGGTLIGMLLLAFSWEWWWNGYIAYQAKVWFPQSLGWAGAILITLVALLVAYLLVLWWEARGGIIAKGGLEEDEPEVSFRDKVGSLSRAIFVRGWPATLGGLLLGTLNVFEYLYKKPWGITTAESRWVGWLLRLGGYPAENLLYFGDKPAGKELLKHIPPWLSGGSVLDWGLIFGAFIGALLASEFKWRFPANRFRYGQALAGGVLMGYGARLAMGCNIGGFFSAIPALGLNGWLFGSGLLIGAFLGVQAIKRLP